MNLKKKNFIYKKKAFIGLPKARGLFLQVCNEQILSTNEILSAESTEFRS